MFNIGILGYGNLGKGVEKAVAAAPDMRLSAVFTRRPQGITLATPDAKTEAAERLDDYIGRLDAVICCGGSATDLMWQTPSVAEKFNFVDSFDTHAQIKNHLERTDNAAKRAGTAGIISAGWDPGLFSLQRLFGEAFLPDGDGYTFWGRGVSQGHSDAVRRIAGVERAVQYTLPSQDALQRVREGGRPALSASQCHTREVYLTVKKDADKREIESKIKNMPDYFFGYDTRVHFIGQDEFDKNHTKAAHGGYVFRNGIAGGARQKAEFSLTLESNPDFTGGVLAACARAALRLFRENKKGAFTLFDIPPAYLSPKPAKRLYEELL